jgi:serine protease Do
VPRKILACALSLALLTGCAEEQLEKVPDVQAKPALAASQGTSRTIQIGKIIENIPRGTLLGQSRRSVFCTGPVDLHWDHGAANLTDARFNSALRDRLKQANYAVAADPSASLFGDQTASSSDLIVGATVDQLNEEICFFNPQGIKGGVYLHVTWQIYDVLQRKVVYETATAGSFRAPDPVTGGLEGMLGQAFDVAVQNLLADQGFHDVAVGAPTGTVAATSGSRPAPDAPAAAQVQIDRTTRSVQLRKVIVNVTPGTIIGHQSGGGLCLGSSPVTWEKGVTNVNDSEFLMGFHNEFVQARYNVIGDPTALFPNTADAAGAELQIGASIDQIDEQYCYPGAGFGNRSSIKGSAHLHVSWQVYDVVQRKVVYQTVTDGTYDADTAVAGGLELLLTQAFSSAAHNLALDPGLHSLLTQQAPSIASPAPNYDLLRISSAADAGPRSIASARAASVVVLVGPSGHGSGFIISPDGYVITNQHVVQGAKQLRVRLADQREMVGRVLRTDPARDVALIKLAATGLPTVKLRSGTLQIGEEVLAIGAPLSEQLDLTVTRGIVSSYRQVRGVNFIQSDVSVHPGNSGGPLVDSTGNVVALCESGVQRGGIDENLNFFIPIDEALSRLNVKLMPAGRYYPAPADTSDLATEPLPPQQASSPPAPTPVVAAPVAAVPAPGTSLTAAPAEAEPLKNTQPPAVAAETRQPTTSLTATAQDMPAAQETVESTNPPASSPATSSPGTWTACIASTKDDAAADTLVNKLKDGDIPASVSPVEVKGELWFRVISGSFPDRGSANAYVRKLIERMGYHGIWACETSR